MLIVEAGRDWKRKTIRLGRPETVPAVESPGATEGAAVRDVALAALYLPCPHCRMLNMEKAADCRCCGLIFSKWRERVLPAPAVMPPVARAGSPFKWIRWVAAAVGLALAAGQGRPSTDVRQTDFEAQVLRASTPVLVMFDIAPQCGCAEEELGQLREQWKGGVAVYTMNAVDSPALAARYGVDKDAMVLLFDKGRLVKSENAARMEERVKSRHGGEYSSDGMKAELEYFVRHA